MQKPLDDDADKDFVLFHEDAFEHLFVDRNVEKNLRIWACSMDMSVQSVLDTLLNHTFNDYMCMKMVFPCIDKEIYDKVNRVIKDWKEILEVVDFNLLLEDMNIDL